MSALREIWKKGETALACWLHAADELTMEVLAQVKYDAYVVDIQHGMSRAQEAIRQLRALQAIDDRPTAMVRISELSSKEVGLYLDAGFMGVICPMVNTRAQAESLVAACRYAPDGDRSWGPTRAMLKDRSTLQGYAEKMRNPWTRPIVLPMIETKQGLENLTEILQSDVDGVFIGPMDLSCALEEQGLGTDGHKTQQAISRIAALAQYWRKVVGIYVSDRSSTEYFISKGFQFVVNAHDKVALMAGARAGLPRKRHRVQTTHVGSLPSPDWLLPILRGEERPPENYEAKLLDATVEIMQKQLDAGLDEINDGEVGRSHYATSALQRLSGLDGSVQGLMLTEKTAELAASCSGPVAYTAAGLKDLQRELARVKLAAQRLNVPLSRVFFSSPSPGMLANIFSNNFYATQQDYLDALAAAMATEYKAIQDEGFKLQVNSSDLAMRHTCHRSLQVKVLNQSLEGMDASRIRMHVCWGHPGEHIPLEDILDILLSAVPKYIALEASNPQHAHEHEVWKRRKLPADKVLMPGVLDPSSSHVEHWRLVAQKLETYSDLLGMDRIMACSDSGFPVAPRDGLPDVVYAKLQSMVKGAATLADSPNKKVVKLQQMQQMAQFPKAEDCDRTTALLMGRTVNHQDDPLGPLECYGYNLTYTAMGPMKGHALQRHSNVEIFVPLDSPFDFACGSGGWQVRVDAGDLIAVPSGVTSYKNLGGSLGRVLSILPGRPTMEDGKEPGIGTNDSNDRLVKKHDSGQPLHLDLGQGWLEIDWLHLKRGEQTQLDKAETVAVVISGAVSCGEALQALDVVQQPSFFSAAADSLILLIKSSLPHDMDF